MTVIACVSANKRKTSDSTKKLVSEASRNFHHPSIRTHTELQTKGQKKRKAIYLWGCSKAKGSVLFLQKVAAWSTKRRSSMLFWVFKKWPFLGKIAASLFVLANWGDQLRRLIKNSWRWMHTRCLCLCVNEMRKVLMCLWVYV